MPMTPEERNRLEALSLPCKEKILAQREAAYNERIALGLGEFEPIKGNQRIENCAVSWRNEAGEIQSETDCTVIVCGLSATVHLLDHSQFYRHLGTPGFKIVKK